MTKLNVNEQLEFQKELTSLAAQNGLHIAEESMKINESGMDFRVAFATDEQGQQWILRQPRREDVWERAENERKVLEVVKSRLPVEVPEWRICTPELIAYPLLDGEPIAVVDPAGGGYAWRFSQDSLSDDFFDSLATSLVALHNIDPDEAIKGGVRSKTPTEAREAFAANIEEIKQSFEVPEQLSKRWEAWLTTDSYWPEHSTFNHGDLHPPHIIVDDAQRVTGLIDWTEAEIADPGKDFVIYYALFEEEGLRNLLNRYEKAGGRTWPRMLEHIREQWAAYPAIVAQFALITGEESNMEMARGMLASWDVKRD
ncbi:macrolide 2'-phosphotransferase [Paenibacillus taichungensis]|uniref:Phosphotransferase n=1 Tax=Paenibacillus taichungensis TaxID=484184 RepID=A0ABX2MM55_9BACL|nr:macrolide 2'-phosphotransferase [Paenibacillus taichungensis]MEC0109542.1 macrolide 2'-phosphotransferase [Paenibacillus taichungensis]MEC0197420.1 macrolide 2'-phosphotransferase [Paenibacillus taichungensis]NUU55122.1 phosphotransferase [Paenibacillus taichungensis]